MSEEIKYSRRKVVDLALSWVGKNEKDGSYKEIIDIYNNYDGELPRGVKMSYNWPWCACTWSALAISLGYTEIMPIEISCNNLIKRAKEMGIWVEKDSYKPLPGDGILYDWDDKGKGDDTNRADHIGVVVEINDKNMIVVEGNKSEAVGKRTVSINGRYIRGFITPKYDDKKVNKEAILMAACRIILGEYGNGKVRKTNIERLGLPYDEVQSLVNSIVQKSKE